MIKMNKWAWIGLVFGMLGLIAGVSVAFFTGGSAGLYTGVGVLLICGVVFFIIFKLLIGPMMNVSRLQKSGVSAKARIKEVRDTGVTINDNPQVKLLLEVKNSLGQVYNASCKALVSRLNPNMFRPGMEIAVKVDPKNEQNVVIDYGHTDTTPYGGSGNMNADQLKAELEALQQEHDSIRASGVSARAIIKTYTWLGAYVNGDNPYAQMEVEVLPESGGSFSATVKGVIGEAAIDKYQPGKEIYVKYDRYDTTKVTVDHS